MASIKFNQKNVLITGATRGIGRSIAELLYECEAKIIAVGTDDASLYKLKQELPGTQTLKINLSDWTETEEVLTTFLENNEVHHLVNNAGVSRLASVGNVPLEDVNFVFDVNVKSYINVTQLVTNQMIKNKIQGTIVNISSQASYLALKDHLVYCASKGAINSMTKVMALELGEHKIRVNSVCPTIVNTEMAVKAWGDGDKANEFKKKICLRRFCEPIEVANTVAFLLSDLSSMINGVLLPVDGGIVD